MKPPSDDSTTDYKDSGVERSIVSLTVWTAGLISMALTKLAILVTSFLACKDRTLVWMNRQRRSSVALATKLEHPMAYPPCFYGEEAQDLKLPVDPVPGAFSMGSSNQDL